MTQIKLIQDGRQCKNLLPDATFRHSGNYTHTFGTCYVAEIFHTDAQQYVDICRTNQFWCQTYGNVKKNRLKSKVNFNIK